MALPSFQQFLLRQPSFPEEMPTDRFYYGIACKLFEAWQGSGLLKDRHESVMQRTAIALTGYYQCVVKDAGLWHAFIDECRNLYGHTLPFFSDDEEYVDYEINLSDVKFLTWYLTAMLDDEHRDTYPLNPELLNLAELFFGVLEDNYDEAPMPEGFHLAHELDMFDPEDAEAISRLGSWLFMHSWLLTPAYAATLSAIVSEFGPVNEDNLQQFQERLSQSMAEDPTGPLALYLREWLWLMLQHKMPPAPRSKQEPEQHKYFAPFLAANDGKRIRFIKGYEALNRFFIEALGWAEGEEHLPTLKDSRDFILMVDPVKGMLIARDIARCVCLPGNDMYDKKFAEANAFLLLTARGVCPPDLLRYLIKENALPDARFPGTDDCKLVADNADFIARCYLQQYYRGD